MWQAQAYASVDNDLLQKIKVIRFALMISSSKRWSEAGVLTSDIRFMKAENWLETQTFFLGMNTAFVLLKPMFSFYPHVFFVGNSFIIVNERHLPLNLVIWRTTVFSEQDPAIQAETCFHLLNLFNYLYVIVTNDPQPFSKSENTSHFCEIDGSGLNRLISTAMIR